MDELQAYKQLDQKDQIFIILITEIAISRGKKIHESPFSEWDK